VVIVRADIATRREAFQAEARIAHRLLSQRAAQHEAILATLALSGLSNANADDSPEKRLAGIYPQLLDVLRHEGDTAWPDERLRAAQARSQASRRPEIASFDAAASHYTLVLAGQRGSAALRVALDRMAPWDEWPLRRDGPVRVALQYQGQQVLLQPGQPAAARPAGLTNGFTFAKALSTPSQPFELRLALATGPAEWPWATLLAWAALSGGALAALAVRASGRRQRRRSQELLRLERIARLGALGELAGGMAHELNQPLAAVLANVQAARRLLEDEPPALDIAREAMGRAAGQARRAADVISRIRRLVENPDAPRAPQPVLLQAVLRSAAELLEPEARRRSITVDVEGQAPAVQADPVALEQIVHNLAANAMQALEEVPADERRIVLAAGRDGDRAVLAVRDSGRGIAPEALPHVFEPFFTSRPDGLGLGLSLCESLTRAMQGSLTARNVMPRGAEFRLSLPLATQQP
jgi:signal transduction histidine kinase